MAAKSNSFSYDLLRLIFNGVTIANIADNAGASPLTQLYVSLHLADPGAGGTQVSSETNYVGYARQAVNRTAAAFPVTAGNPPQVDLAAQLNFPAIGAGSANQTITHFGIGTDPAGAGELLYHGPVIPNIPIQVGLAAPALLPATYVQET